MSNNTNAHDRQVQPNHSSRFLQNPTASLAPQMHQPAAHHGRAMMMPYSIENRHTDLAAPARHPIQYANRPQAGQTLLRQDIGPVGLHPTPRVQDQNVAPARHTGETVKTQPAHQAATTSSHVSDPLAQKLKDYILEKCGRDSDLERDLLAYIVSAPDTFVRTTSGYLQRNLPRSNDAVTTQQHGSLETQQPVPPHRNYVPAFARTNPRPPSDSYHALPSQQQSYTPTAPTSTSQPNFVQGSSREPVQQPLPMMALKTHAPRKRSAKGKGKRKAATIEVNNEIERNVGEPAAKRSRTSNSATPPVPAAQPPVALPQVAVPAPISSDLDFFGQWERPSSAPEMPATVPNVRYESQDDGPAASGAPTEDLPQRLPTIPSGPSPFAVSASRSASQPEPVVSDGTTNVASTDDFDWLASLLGGELPGNADHDVSPVTESAEESTTTSDSTSATLAPVSASVSTFNASTATSSSTPGIPETMVEQGEKSSNHFFAAPSTPEVTEYTTFDRSFLDEVNPFDAQFGFALDFA